MPLYLSTFFVSVIGIVISVIGIRRRESLYKYTLAFFILLFVYFTLAIATRFLGEEGLAKLLLSIPIGADRSYGYYVSLISYMHSLIYTISFVILLIGLYRHLLTRK